MNLAMRMDLFRQADLYVVITESCCAGHRGIEVLEACLDAGVRLVQMREKHLDDGNLYETALAWRQATRDAGALFIMDDRVDISLAADADGVHLGQSDLPPRVARTLAPELILGVSTHSLEEARTAQEQGASYINIGPIFPTQTKEVASGAVGPEMIGTIRPHLHIPFTCMGGIKLENVNLVLEQGASIAAVVTAVTAAPDVKAAALALRQRIRLFTEPCAPFS